MAATPLFVITDAGLAVASQATAVGPFVHITEFQVGSAFGYTPTRDDPGLNGNVLFAGTPLTYTYIGDNTIDILCQLPLAAGPFDFGEVALFCEDINGNSETMFAKAVFDTPQTKYSALGTNVVATYSFHCLLKLEQSVAVFQVDTTSGIPPAVWTVDQWSDVVPAGLAANPDIPLVIVRELTEFGDSTLLQNTSDAEWTVGTSYSPINNHLTNAPGFTVVNASTSWVEVAAGSMHTPDVGAANRRWLLRTPDGYFRSTSSVAVSGANYRLNLNVTNDGTYNNSPLPSIPAVNSVVQLFRDDQRGGTIYYSQIADPPTIASATPGVPGLATAGDGLYIEAAGFIAANGLLQTPGGNTGRILGAADNLNSFALPSGLFTTAAGSFGLPANMPVAYDCQIWMHKNGTSDYTQIAYPANFGGGDPSGNGGYPPFWRQGYNGGVWTSWFPFSVPGKVGQQATGTVSIQGVGTSFATTVTARSNYHFFGTDGGGGSSSQLTWNGNIVSRNTKAGGGGYGRINHDTCFYMPGDALSWNSPAGGTMVIFTF